MPFTRLHQLLEQQHVPYQTIRHRTAYSAQETAAAAHVPGRELAKVVMVRSGGAFVMLVVPAPYRVDLERAKSAVGKSDLVLATEDEFTGLFPQCEAGAMPPFGNLYDLPVYVDQTLTRDEEIVFNAGTHTQTVKMKYADFARLVQPKVVAVAATH